eukprot:SAG25_NODE_414_length_8276_cov_29.934939_9_plen_216_part_01
MASVCAFKLPILKKAITKFRKSERIVGPKGTVAIQKMLLKHGDSAEGSKTLLRKRWAQVRKQDHPPVGKMKAIDVYKYMYFVADKLDFDWTTVLTSGEKAKVSRKCYNAPKPGETPDVPAQIVPKTRTFKRTRWHDIVSDVFKDSQYASRTFKDKMLVAKRLYAQEKREGSAADRTRADREETQVRSKEERATLSRAGSMRRKPPAPNEFQQRAAL